MNNTYIVQVLYGPPDLVPCTELGETTKPVQGGWHVGSENMKVYIYIPIGSMYAIYGNMDPINIPQMLAYIAYMDPMGYSKE